MLHRSTTASSCRGSTHAATQSAASSSAVSKVDSAQRDHPSALRLRMRQLYAVFEASGSPAYSMSEVSRLSTTPLDQAVPKTERTSSSYAFCEWSTIHENRGRRTPTPIGARRYSTRRSRGSAW